MNAVLAARVRPLPPPDLAAVRRRQQAAWASADFAVIGTTLQIVGELLAEAVDVRAGDRVLDVGAGNGNATLAAARRYADVTSTDCVPAQLEKGRRRAAAEGLLVQFKTADAEALPFEDRRFDTVLSTFGAMFAADHAATAAEMLRVLRRGGRIGLACWTPDGFVGRLLNVIGAHVPGPPGLQSPALWGTEAHLRQLFGGRIAQLHGTRQVFNFRHRSAEHWVQLFRQHCGLTRSAFAALSANGQAALQRDLLRLLGEFDAGNEHTLVVPAAYLQVVIQTRGVG